MTLILISVIPIFNYFVDPAGLFTTNVDGSVEKNAAELILSGHGAEGLVNYDERLLKRLCIYGIDKSTEVLALGSSRVALITSNMVEGSFFNLSVTGAGLEDIIGIFGVTSVNGFSPERVIIALDPWFINSEYSSGRFKGILTDGYSHCLVDLMGYSPEDVGYSPAVSGKYLGSGYDTCFFDFPPKMQLELFSIPYFQSSLEMLLNPVIATHLLPVDKFWSYDASIRADGSYCYPYEYRENIYEEIYGLAEDQIKTRIIGSENAKFGDKNVKIFRDFVASLTNMGIRVDLIEVPLNPILWDHMLQHEHYQPIIQSEELFRSIAKETGCNIIGSFDPHDLGAEVEDFYDGYHYKPEGIEILVSILSEAR